jgi:hypothetical protein
MKLNFDTGTPDILSLLIAALYRRCVSSQRQLAGTKFAKVAIVSHLVSRFGRWRLDFWEMCECLNQVVRVVQPCQLMIANTAETQIGSSMTATRLSDRTVRHFPSPPIISVSDVTFTLSQLRVHCSIFS